MRLLLKVIIPYLLIGLSIGATYLVATECLLSALAEPQGDSLPSASVVERRTPSLSPVRSISPTSGTNFAPPAIPAPVTSRPAPGQSGSFHDMENALALEQRNPRAARTIRSLAWVADGIDDEEREGAEALIYLAATSENVFGSLTGRAWLNSPDFRQAGPAVVDLENIAFEDKEAARRLVDMPFLETLQPPDVLALRSLSRMAYFDLPSFQRTLRHPSIRDGIGDEEARIVALLDWEYASDVDLMNTLLDPTLTMVEERNISLPLAGEITLAVIRTSPGAPRSMDLFESSVRGAERLIEEPFPATYVPLLFAETVPGGLSGSHNGTHITILPEFDADDGSHEAQQSPTVIAHEVAHYYWRWSQSWLDEGAAEFTAAFLHHQESGGPLEPANYPCGREQTIPRLEGRSAYSSDLAYICNYAVGERFFLDLYQRLGQAAFLPGIRSLYRDVVQTGSNGVEPPGIGLVRKAFTSAAEDNAAAVEPIVEEVIDRWNEGVMPSDQTNVPDGRPVVAELPEVYGWVDRAYVSLEEAGRPVHSFSVSDAGEWVWLTLEYSHDYAGPPTELTFEVVEYYEDGFPYRRNTLTLAADRGYAGGVQWLSIGPGPGQNWAPGRHWIYVHHEGRKVAQVEFEVTP